MWFQNFQLTPPERDMSGICTVGEVVKMGSQLPKDVRKMITKYRK